MHTKTAVILASKFIDISTHFGMCGHLYYREGLQVAFLEATYVWLAESH
jgi:hypothetical protein